MKLFKKAKKGFTLVELVVVIAVIAILSAVSVGAYFGITESAKNSQASQEGKAVHTNIVLVANDPANDCGASFHKEGLKAKLTGGTESTTDLDTLEEAVEFAAGVKYTFSETDLNAETYNFATSGAYVKFTKSSDGYYTEMKYYVDATHSATFDIVTGAQK